MTTTASDPAIQAKQMRGKVTLVGCLFATALLISVGAWWLDRVPPQPNFAGYYEGPWVNKRGELVAADGTILRRAAAPVDTGTTQLP